MKDPAFLFYPESFLLGTMIMPFEEKGKYITLLCYQHQNGHLSEETIRLLIGSFSDILKSKFVLDKNGLYYNERLESEIQKRSAFIDSRRENGKNGGRPKKANGKPYGKPNAKPRAKPSEKLIINRDIIRNIITELSLSSDYLLLWDRWKRYKLEQHKFNYASDDSEKTGFEKLLKLSNSNYETSKKIIEQSIANGWSGFFDLKEKESEKKIISNQTIR